MIHFALKCLFWHNKFFYQTTTVYYHAQNDYKHSGMLILLLYCFYLQIYPLKLLIKGYQKHLYKTMQSRIIMRHKKTHEALWGRRSIKDYKFIKQLGEGTYGMVYKAFDTEDDNLVAIKKVRCENEKDGFPIFVIREIKILKQLMHQNVISLKVIDLVKKKYDILLDFTNHCLIKLIQCKLLLLQKNFFLKNNSL